MKHLPRKTEHEHNNTKEHPLRGLGLFIFFTSVFMGTLYFFIGFSTNFLVDKLSIEQEDKIFNYLRKTNIKKTSTTLTIDDLNTSRVDSILKELLVNSDLQRKNIKIQAYTTKEENAYAYPDGNIYVTKKLIEAMPEDRDLAMVIAHELGHYKNRDHLKGFGRGIVLLITGIIFMGETITNGILANLFDQVSNKHNRDQESAADMYGVELLYKTYGSTKGALGYFEHMEKKRVGLAAFASYLNTHPTSKDRIKKIKKLIRKKYKD